jgi:hypothetical protein
VREGTYLQTRQLAGGDVVLGRVSYQGALVWDARLALACRCVQEFRAFADDPAG